MGKCGKYGAGNIDLKSRPQYQNADGTISTVDSWSFFIDGKEVLLPSVWMKDGKPYHSSNADEIFRHYKETGEYLGKFDTVEQANAYAKKLHQEQNQYYNVYQNAKFDLGEAMYDAMIGAAMGLIGDAGNIVNTTRQASVDNRGVKNAGSAVDVSQMKSGNTVPPVDAKTLSDYNESKVSPAASAQVQQTEVQAQVTQAENPGSTVLDAATTLFAQQGMKLKTAQEKAGIVQKLIAGEEVSVRDINKLNPTSKESQALFTQLTGVQFPEGKVTQEQLYNLYRSAHDAAVQAATVPINSTEGREAFPGVNRVLDEATAAQQEAPATQEQQTTDTLTKRMADAGFQANPETQDRIAQAQAELNDAVNGTATAASRKTGNVRNSITLKTGDTLTRDQFKQVMQELYAEKGVNLTDNQLDAAFNNFLSTADRGGDISGLEAMAEYLKNKEENTNEAEPAGRSVPVSGGLRGESDQGAAEQRQGVPGRDGEGKGTNQTGAASVRGKRTDAGRTGGERTGENRKTEALRSDSERAPGVSGGYEGNNDPGAVGSRRGQAESGGGRADETRNLSFSERGESDEAELKQQKSFIQELRQKRPPVKRVRPDPSFQYVRVLDKSYWTQEMLDLQKDFARVGVKLNATIGEIRSKEGITANGVALPGKAFARADHPTRTFKRSASHELIHEYIMADNALGGRLMFVLQRNFDQTKLDGIINQYIKQRVLQDYMLHRHNIDRMSFREKALNAVESYEQSYPWLASLEPREFAELVADGNRIAQRYQELIEQFQKAKDKPIFTDSEGKPVTAEFSRNLISQYEQQYDWVKEKAEGIYDWWDKFMQEWVVGDSLSAEEYATLRETYPAYVPTYRKDKPGLGKGVSSFGGTVTAKKAVRAATGGTSAVANIEDSFNMLMEKNVSSQRTNMVLRSITDTAMLDDAGDFNGFAVFDWNEAPEMLRWGLAAEGFEGALEAGTDQAAAKALSKDDGGVYRVRAWANGERVSAIVDPELYKALDFAFNQKTGWFTKVGQTLTSPMKTFITGINPAFAMRNTIRDNLTAQMNSISVVNSISGIKFEKYYAKAWQEMVSGSENWQHFVALGGTNAGYYNNEGGTYITNLNRQKMQDLNPVNKVGKALGFIGEHTEQVTRFAEYLATIDRLPGGDTYGNRLVGIKNAAEVTVDFSRKGTLGKAFNAWIPYWNPTVQGIDKTVRTFFDQPTVAGKAKVLSRAALTTLPLDILLFAIYHALDRDDEWEELSDRTKDTYYCIPLPDEHKFLKIPKSRDWGQIIGNPIMRMLQGLDGREDPFENYFEVSIKPNFLWSNPLDAVLLSTQYDLAKNEDFAGRAIVPSNYQKMAKGDQWNSDTSKYAKVIADIGNMFVEEDGLSPMQIDYVINDYFGDFGSMFQRLFSIGGNDKQASAEEQAKMVAEDLLGNWVADNRYSSATVSDYYDMLDKVSQEVAAERVQNPDGYKDTPMYKLNSAFNAKGSASDQITELNAQVRGLPDGPEKDAIKGQIVELAREALQMYDAVMSGDITEPKMEMEYSKYGDKVKTALTDLADYAEDYAFLPSDYKPSSYTDPKNKNKEYVLDDAAKAKYRELYDEEYASVMEAVIKSSKYRSASAEKRAELLEAARDDVAPQVKEEFLKWLAKNYKSTPKKK